MATTKDIFTYTAPFTNVVSATPQTYNLKIEADSDFLIMKINYFATIAGAAQTDSTRVIPLVEMSLKDSGSGRNLFNNPTPIPSFAGEGDLPFILPVDKLLRANSNLQVTVNNFSKNTTYDNLYISFIGAKLWEY